MGEHDKHGNTRTILPQIDHTKSAKAHNAALRRRRSARSSSPKGASDRTRFTGERVTGPGAKIGYGYKQNFVTETTNVVSNTTTIWMVSTDAETGEKSYYNPATDEMRSVRPRGKSIKLIHTSKSW